MRRAFVERRLRQATDRLARAREELRVADSQLEQLADEADDARIRSMVSETPLADRDHREAQRHADRLRDHRSRLVESITRLEQRQDDLLDQLTAGQGR